VDRCGSGEPVSKRRRRRKRSALLDRRRGRERERTAAPAGEAGEAFAATEARRLDSSERWLDSNDACRGKPTPDGRKAGKRREENKEQAREAAPGPLGFDPLSH